MRNLRGPLMLVAASVLLVTVASASRDARLDRAMVDNEGHNTILAIRIVSRDAHFCQFRAGDYEEQRKVILLD